MSADGETVMAVYDEWEAANEKVAALSLDALTHTELRRANYSRGSPPFEGRQYAVPPVHQDVASANRQPGTDGHARQPVTQRRAGHVSAVSVAGCFGKVAGSWLGWPSCGGLSAP